MTPKCEVTSLCFSKLWSLPYTVDCCTWLKMVVVNLLSNYNLQTYLGNNASSDRPNWCIVRNQPNRIFGNSLSESSAEVRPNRTMDQSLLKWYNLHIYLLISLCCGLWIIILATILNKILEWVLFSIYHLPLTLLLECDPHWLN